MTTSPLPHAAEGGLPTAGPALVAVLAPWCGHCAALRPRLHEVANRWRRDVELLVIDLDEQPEAAGDLAIRATPTLIGLGDGVERFRHTGSRTSGELERLFASLAGELAGPARIGGTDAGVRLASGAGLMLAGMLAGPAWPLVVIGAGVVGFGWWTWARRET